MYELNQVRQFLKVVECGSIIKAAEALNITQPGLSRSMHRLEEELSVALFERTKNSISLNENGKKAAELFSELYAQAESVQEKLRSKKNNLVTVCSPSPTLFDKVKAQLLLTWPECTVKTELGRYEQILEKLLKEQCDLIQLAFPCEHKDVYSAVFEEESLFLLLPDNHRLAAKKEGIFINEIAGETLLALPEAGYWTEIVKKLIPDAHIIYQNEQTDFEALIEASTLPTFMTDSMLISHPSIPGRTIIPLLDDYLNLTVYCCCLKKNRERFERFFELAEV